MEGDWEELLNQLIAGDIDLLGAVTYREARTELIDYAAKPMGKTGYYLVCATRIMSGKGQGLSFLDGAVLAFKEASFQFSLWESYLERMGVHAELKGVHAEPDEVADMLISGEIDAYLTESLSEDYFCQGMNIVKLAEEDCYFATNKQKPELKTQLDAAMEKVQQLHPFLLDDLQSQYLTPIVNSMLSEAQTTWLDNHGSITIGFLNGDLAEQDPVTGQVNGVLAEYMATAAHTLEGRDLTFEARPYASLDEMLAALDAGEVDMLFPLVRSLYYGELHGYRFSSELLSVPMAAITEQANFIETDPHTVAVPASDITLKWYLSEFHPNWEVVEFETIAACEKAVDDQSVDCLVTDAYQVQSYLKKKANKCVYLSDAKRIAFMMRDTDTTLLSIINQTIAMMPGSAMQGALTKYVTPEHVTTLTEFIEENAVVVVLIVTAIFAIFMLVIYGFLLKAKKSEREMALLNDDLAIAVQSAESANAAKSVFLSNMSHDIRTPMNAIVGFTTLAVRDIDDKDKVRDCLNKILSSSNHLLSLINDVLDMSRIESGKIHLEEKETNLSDLMHDLKIIASGQIHAKQLDLFMDALDVTDEDVFCDKTRLNQVLLNLLSNAIKFTPAGGAISVRLKQLASTTKGIGRYEIRVKDTGIGMSADFAEKIFQPFERERTSTVSKIQGTGLGMAISKNIVDMMGGTIEVFTEQGKGTEYVLELPLRLQAHQGAEDKLDALNGMHALVVDDDFNTCDSVTRMLIKAGMKAEWTLSGREAVLRARQAMELGKTYQAYIIDWRLPDMNGIEVTRQIRALGDDTPIIILTAYDWANIEEEALAAGVTGFCSKPLFMSDLRDSLLTAMGRKEKPVETMASVLPAQPVDFKGKKLLLVEDNELNREIATEILEGYGFIIDSVENGAIAVEKLANAKAGDVDVVLMDIQMPVMDGCEAARRIRQLADKDVATLPIIAMTANAFDDDRRETREAGMDGFLSKPIDLDAVIKTLESVLGGRKS